MQISRYRGEQSPLRLPPQILPQTIKHNYIQYLEVVRAYQNEKKRHAGLILVNR